MTTRSHTATRLPPPSPPSPERWRRTLPLPLGTSLVQLGSCAPSSQPQGAPRPPAPLPPPSEHRPVSLSPPLPAPGIRALSSGAEAPEASRGARPGNSAARPAGLGLASEPGLPSPPGPLVGKEAGRRPRLAAEEGLGGGSPPALGARAGRSAQRRGAGAREPGVARGPGAGRRESRSRCLRGARLAARPSHACSAAASQVGPPSAPPPESGPGTGGARTGALEF